MDVQRVIKGIRTRIEGEKSVPVAFPGSADYSASHRSPEANELAALKAAYGRLYQIRNLVGQNPPAPNTPRARLGGYLVRLVQRMLFWYTPQIRRFHDETASVLGSTCVLLQRQLEMIAELRREVQTLRRERTSVDHRNGENPEPGRSKTTGSLPAEFQFALQDHFRGSEQDTIKKLRVWLGAIEALTPAGVAFGDWVDIGCGRGEWLALASQKNHRITGVDSSPESIEYCRAKGLRAEAADAIDYLRLLPDSSLHVVTAFHVAEHIPLDRLLALTMEISRKLRPGGLFVVETPNPENVLMGSHYFWNDPTHQRPIPPTLLEFIFSYCGLRKVKRLELNPAPAEEHLPYTEIDVIRRVDEHLYGPRDYGLIGRRED